MKKMIIFDPAMCCSTGVCGPSINTELLRVATVLNKLKEEGIIVERHNLSNNPQAFVENEIVNKLLNAEGVEVLPIIIIDNKVVKTKGYPTNAEFCKWLDISEEVIKTKIKFKSKGCGCKGGCC